jgi:3'(2'), 5'-bisphosphate nucleotidase
VWDHAAGAIVISEAGGRVSDLNGESAGLLPSGRLLGGPGQGIIATNGRLHEPVLEAARAVTGWRGLITARQSGPSQREAFAARRL